MLKKYINFWRFLGNEFRFSNFSYYYRIINRSYWRILWCSRIHEEVFQDNPPISEDMIAAMMAQMGQKPSAKKLNQVMNMMKHQQQK